MRSTGEVLGLADSFGLAFFKAQEAAQAVLPSSGTILISVNDSDKPEALEVARAFAGVGFKIKATGGTCKYLNDNGVAAELVLKLHEGRPNLADAITNREICLVINTAAGKRSQFDDSYIRKSAIKTKIPYITTMTAAMASARGIADYLAGREQIVEPRSLQEYHKQIIKL
jgi:carbamoyl-phosphate synthase large subunit